MYVDLNLENKIGVTTLNTCIVTLGSAFNILNLVGLDQAVTGEI